MNLKIIVGLLVGLILIQLVGALIYFFVLNKTNVQEDLTELGPTTSIIDPNTPGNGLIKLETNTPSVPVGEEIAVNILIDTDNKPVEGVDLSLKYDSSYLEPVLLNQLPFVPGRLFPDVPLNSFNNRLGVASMSAISSLNQNYVGAGTLGQITFKAKKAGQTTVTVQAEPENTTDSNMVSAGREILARTENLIITIK